MGVYLRLLVTAHPDFATSSGAITVTAAREISKDMRISTCYADPPA
jgi:hypothetical protein